MRRIFTVAKVKNENDIIESFCRYNLTYCDGMIIKDNGSIDGTIEIIQSLIDEGLPVYLVYAGGMIDSAHKAIDEYNADLVVPLDADEFLYHIDGINPREILEKMQEDVEYQAIWRTYIYEKEPDIELGFMPNNFICYRNPEMENPIKYERHKKVIASKYLLKNKQATFVGGAHFLVYPEADRNIIKTEICEKLVFAHFPIRSRAHVMKKVIPNWIYKWKPSYRAPREILDISQVGVIFNEIRDFGDVTPEKIKQYSLNYAMLLDYNTSNEIAVTSKEELDKIKNDLGEHLEIAGPMNTNFYGDKLELRYTDYTEDSKVFIRVVLKEVDDTVMAISSESGQRAEAIDRLTQHINELTKQGADLRQHINALSQQINESIQQNTALNLQNSELVQQITAVNKQNEDLNNNANTLTQQNIELGQQNNELTQRNIDLARQINDLNLQADTLTLKNNELMQHNNSLAQQISDIYDSNTWKAGKKLQRVYRTFIPHQGK